MNYEKIILSSNSHLNPRCITTLQIKILKNLYKINLVNILWDTSQNNFLKKREDVYICDKNILLDNINFKEKHNYKKNNIVESVIVFDNETLLKKSKNKNLNKDIDLIFMGQVSSYRDNRAEIVNFLKKNTNIFLSTKDRNEFMPDDLYFNYLSRSKITVNMSMSIDFHQIKGRCYESFIFQTLLMEDKNSPILEYFTPNEDLIIYNNKYDLLDKINFYLKNEKERKKIVENAHHKYLTKFNSKYFYDKIF